MARRKSRGRPVDGILILNKPLGISSNTALQHAKRLFGAAKAGHTGSLDPLATGVLPICFGEATKFTQFLLDSDKTYLSTFRLGVSTETGDCDGDIIGTSDASMLNEAEIQASIDNFRGDIKQIPSMYSALKHEGQPLYKLARQGITVERKARPVTIFSYELLAFRPGQQAEVDVEISCSKGTYIRSLAEDLGAALGCGAHVVKLHRSVAGPFGEDKSATFEDLEPLCKSGDNEALDSLLMPMDSAVTGARSVTIPESIAYYLRLGQAVMAPDLYQESQEGEVIRIFHTDGMFLGVGEIMDDGRIQPRRLVVSA